MLPILTSIKKEGQKYVDKEIFAEPADRFFTPLGITMARIFGHIHGVGTKTVRSDLPPCLLLRYTHTKLRWMTPDGNGNLVPK